MDLDNAKYIQAYTTSGQLYPVLFIDSEDDFIVGSNAIETRIRSNDTNLIHDTTSGRYTIYDSNNLDITKWNISQLTTSVDNVTSSGIKYYNVSESDVENLPVEDSSYGIISTFAKLDNNNPGTNDTWGFQLANPNNSDSLWYRNFKGLTKNPWKELATVDQINNLQLEDIVSYGIEWDTEVSDPDCTRIGNLSLHKSLPIQNKMRGCVAKGKEIQYYLNPTDWSQKEDGTPSVLDGTDGDVMVYIPKFWIKSGSNNTKRWVKIATNYIDETWIEVPEMLISAYRVTTDRTNAENIKLMSVVNTTQNFAGSFGIEDPTNPYRTALGKPRTTMSRQSARTYAHNKQDGTELLCYEYYKDVLYWLPVIEYATFNM